jgi:hypothetical protein
MAKWDHLLEADAKERELERQAHGGDVEAQRRLKGHRIRTGTHRQFDEVIALVGSPGWHNSWKGKWVRIHRHEGRIDDERSSDEYGFDQDDWEKTWVIGIGMGYSTIRFLVYAAGLENAVNGCEEEWPDEFVSQEDGNVNSDMENQDEVDIRIAAECVTWEVARQYKGYRNYELLDGRVVEAI